MTASDIPSSRGDIKGGLDRCIAVPKLNATKSLPTVRYSHPEMVTPEIEKFMESLAKARKK